MTIPTVVRGGASSKTMEYGFYFGNLLGNLKDQTGGERRLWKRERSSMWWDVVVKDHWTDNDWIENFRMSKATFMFICEKMRDKITYHNTNMRRALPVEQRMAITIWRLATNCGYRIISDLFGVGRSTVCMIIQQTCKAFASSMQKEFMEVFTPGKVQVTIDSFMNTFGFPQIGGCIGTCQIPIKLPESNYPLECISAKGNPSIFLQGIVDEKGQFLDMTAGQYGSTSDVQVFSQSHLYEAAIKGTLFPNSAIDIEGVSVPAQLLAGPGFPLLPNVTKAYDTSEGELTNQQHLFNQQVADVRRVMDKAFSRLKGRWQILTKRNEHKIALIPSIATACSILHNICEQRDEVFNIDLLDGQEGIEIPAVPTIKQEDFVAQNIRQALTLNIYKKLGPF
ncbi:protein ALP1-like isoform X2 [Asterias rubens]|uniref:protein ALP1-like isoform X2 n=1 Tax=Asterias rubens TaxID=7604 RepID=UPI001455D410|nr:protein ALP1-like isoform X2 [Asterias rubens]